MPECSTTVDILRYYFTPSCFLLDFLSYQHVFLNQKLIYYKKEAMKTRNFSFSIPPASPGTNLPVSSSQTQPQVPHWPRRRFSSPNPAAWDHVSQMMHHSTPQSKHKVCVPVVVSLLISYLFSKDDRLNPRAPASSTPKRTTKNRKAGSLSQNHM